MTRRYLLSTLAAYRGKLHAAKLHDLANLASALIESLLDAGRMWQPLVPRIHTVVAYFETEMVKQTRDTTSPS